MIIRRFFAIVFFAFPTIAFCASQSVTACNCATDVTTIQAAIDNVEPTGGVVTLVAGTYSLTGSVKVPGGVILQGEGQKSILTGGVSNGALIENKYSNQDSWTIRDLALIPDANVTGIRSNGLPPTTPGGSDAQRPNRLTIKDVQISAADNIIYARGYDCNFSSNTRVINLGVSQAEEGVYQDDCADNDYVNVSVQLGTQWGFTFKQTDPFTYNEGTRLVNCSTNGQKGGIRINGADWVNVSNSSFTTSPTLGAALVDNNSVHWNFIGTEFASAGSPVAAAGLIVQPGSVEGNVSGSKFVLNTFGAIIYADDVRIVGNSFDNNFNVPLISAGIGNTIHDNQIRDTNGWNGSGFSLWIQPAAQRNSVKGNILTQVFLDQGVNTNWGLVNQNMCLAGLC